MTSQEYKKIFRDLRKTMGSLTVEQQKNLLKIYSQAAKEASKALLSVSDSLERIQLEAMTELLKRSAQMVADSTNKTVLSLLKSGFDIIGDGQKELIEETASRAGLRITGLDEMIFAINNRLIAATVNRTYANGYTYSERVWGQFDANGNPIGVFGDWINRIKNVVNIGIAQGIDPVQIARDTEKFLTSEGGIREKIEGRWGKLVPGTDEYIRRIGQAPIDYRAMRLVRSELYSSLQTASIEFGRSNPGSTGMYNWILQQGRESWPCDCEDLAKGSPYKEEDIPEYPHPLCFCSIEPQIMNMDEFTQMMKDYKDGIDNKNTRAMDEWARREGLTITGT
jgi:hypothetical protein